MILHAFYDLKICPVTYDISTFLTLAENERKETNCEYINIVIVPNDGDGFRKGDRESYGCDLAMMKWRKDHIVIPCCNLLPSVKGIFVLSSRDEIELDGLKVFPKGYRLYSPRENHLIYHLPKDKEVKNLTANPEAIKYVKSVLPDKKVISITLRESTYETERNSNLKAWGDFARNLDSSYYPVFVRDTERALQPIPAELRGLNFFNEAAWNIELRMALYQSSYLNMAVNNGAIAISIFGINAKTMVFKLITDSCPAASKRFYANQGINIGDQFLKGTALVWEDDTYENIKRGFDAFQLCNLR